MGAAAALRALQAAHDLGVANAAWEGKLAAAARVGIARGGPAVAGRYDPLVEKLPGRLRALV